MFVPFFGFEIDQNSICRVVRFFCHFLDQLCKISAIMAGVMKSELFFGLIQFLYLNNRSLIYQNHPQGNISDDNQH